MTPKPEKTPKRYAGKIKLATYVDDATYQKLALFKDPVLDRWEAALVRRIILEWLEARMSSRRPLLPGGPEARGPDLERGKPGR